MNTTCPVLCTKYLPYVDVETLSPSQYLLTLLVADFQRSLLGVEVRRRFRLVPLCGVESG